jgi:hypothetical protein
MKKITLRLSGNGVWLATWSGPETSYIVSVMGSDTVETPFLRGYDSEEMRRKIAAKNPGYVVEVA